MDWWEALWGTAMVAAACVMPWCLRGEALVTTTGTSGEQQHEVRRLRAWEVLGLLVLDAWFGASGVLLLLGALPWTERRVPEQQLLGVVVAAGVTAGLVAAAVVVGHHAWTGRRSGIRSAAAGLDPEDSPGDAVVGFVTRLVSSHPAGAALTAVVFGALAVLSAWRLDDAYRVGADGLVEVYPWLQPLDALSGWLGLPPLLVAAGVLAVWVVVASASGEGASAALVLLLVGLYGVLALVAWPLGLLDEWLGLGRWVLELV